eukprot:3577916-Alexandrium_andersonii.AAC.1
MASATHACYLRTTGCLGRSPGSWWRLPDRPDRPDSPDRPDCPTHSLLGIRAACSGGNASALNTPELESCLPLQPSVHQLPHLTHDSVA